VPGAEKAEYQGVFGRRAPQAQFIKRRSRRGGFRDYLPFEFFAVRSRGAPGLLTH
jgi:hypothetical protein